jgi:hypothetical protein
MRKDWPDWPDKRYRKLISWLANEHAILEKALGHKPTIAEHRAHAHAFIDIVFDDDEKADAEWAVRKAQAEAKVIPLVPPQP